VGSIWLVILIAWAVWLLRPRSRSALLPPQRRRAVPWGGLEVLLAFLVTQFLWPTVLSDLLGAVGFFRRVYGPEFGTALVSGAMSPNDRLRMTLWQSDLALPLTVTSLTALLWVLSGTRPYQLGLTANRLGKNLLLGVLTAICVVPVVYLIMLGVNRLLLQGVGEAPEEHPITKMVLGHPLPIDLVVGGLAALVAAPIQEELLFRGIVQPWFRTRRAGGWVGIAAAVFLAVMLRWPGIKSGWLHGWERLWPELLPAGFVVATVPGYLLARARLPAAAGAVYATSALFASAHSFTWPSPVPLFFFALALGALRYRTQSLVPSIVAHGLFNAVAWVLLLWQMTHPASSPEKGKETADARARPELVSTSSAVPGSALPRRT
jgi:membrane protease YdiL (CAAX protease family)